MKVEFKDATVADIPAIVALLKDDVLGATREAQNLKIYEAAFERMSGNGANRIIVAWMAGRIVGTYQFITIEGLSLSAMKRAQIESVRVMSDLRSKGIGALLMEDALKRARAEGCGLMQLMTNQTRSETHRFYEKLGYEQSHFGYKLKL